MSVQSTQISARLCLPVRVQGIRCFHGAGFPSTSFVSNYIYGIVLFDSIHYVWLWICCYSCYYLPSIVIDYWMVHLPDLFIIRVRWGSCDLRQVSSNHVHRLVVVHWSILCTLPTFGNCCPVRLNSHVHVVRVPPLIPTLRWAMPLNDCISVVLVSNQLR